MAPAATRRTVLAGGATLLAGGAAAQQATPLRLYSLGYATEAATLAFEVPRRTGGRYQVERIIGFDALEATLGKERVAGGERALLEGARSGDLDLVISSALVLGEYLPEALVFFVPFLFRDYAHARAVLDGPIGQDVLARLAAPGPVGLAWTELGLRYVTTNKRAIQAPEDLRGLKLRVSQNAIAVETFRTLGAEAVPMLLGRALLDALTQGALDGAEFDVSTILEWEVFRSQQYLSLTGHIYAPAIILMSKVVYDRLSDADRQAFVEAAQVAVQNGRKDTDNAEATGFAQLVGTGMKINTDVDKAAFRAELAPAYAKWREQFGDLIDRIQAYQ